MLENLDEPAIIFLDAHYSGGTTARAEKDTPLLEELDIVRQRTYPDIVIIDDTSFLGQKGGSEPEERVPDDVPWPSFVYDWSETTETAVRAKLNPEFTLITNKNGLMTSSREDQYILYLSCHSPTC